MSPPSGTSLPHPTPSHPSRLSQNTGFELSSYSKFRLAIYFAYGDVYVSMLLSQFLPPLHRCVHKSVFYVCISIPAPQIGSSLLSF